MSPAVATSAIRIFLLDDARELRHRVRGALAAEPGLTVVGEADDPVDGLPLIEDLQPDVVVCDLSMPRMDGLEAIPQIATGAPDAGIVIFSGFLDEALGSTALAAGADRYVEKSAPLEDLEEAVREVAAARRAGERPQPRPAVAPPAAAAPELPASNPLQAVVAEARSLSPRAALVVSLASLAMAFGLTNTTPLVPSTFLVLWLMPVLVVGAMFPWRVGVPFVAVAAAGYTYSSYNAGASTWYAAGIGVAIAMAAGAIAARRLMAWMRAGLAQQDQLAAELRRSNAELEHFAYVASHDLAAPLRTVSSFTSMLAKRHEGRLDPETDRMIGFITGGSARMQRMIDDLLAFARAGRVETTSGPFALGDVLDQVRADLAGQIAERGATVTDDGLPHLSGDRTRIAQVLQNLVANAIKFCPPDRAPLVNVSASRLAAGWRVDVRDNGIGVDPRFASKVFGMFQRLHNDQDFPGTGIGLAICQRIVERHGGRIWVDGFEGEGSTFSFTLPDPAG